MSELVLADDSTTIQKVVKLSFAGEDLNIHTFEDGATALEYVRKQGCDIVLADINLPLLDGYDFCSQLKANPDTSHIPVVLLAGTFEPFDVRKAEEAGYDGSLTKPFETSQLVDVVRGLLQEAESSEGVAIKEASETPAVTEDLLFKIPVPAVEDAVHFSLTTHLCRADFELLERTGFPEKVSVQTIPPSVETIAAVQDSPAQVESIDREQMDVLLSKVMERLPEKLRSILPEVAEDLVKDRKD